MYTLTHIEKNIAASRLYDIYGDAWSEKIIEFVSGIFCDDTEGGAERIAAVVGYFCRAYGRRA